MPPEAWGDNLKRCELAAFIAAKVKEAFGWPNDYFVPEDSFWVMMFPPEDDLCGVEVMMDIEDRFALNLSEEDLNKATGMTFGEFVDFILRLSEAYGFVVGPERPEEHPCPSAAVFWNLRAYARTRLGIERRAMLPGALLRGVFKREHRVQIDKFLVARFGVRSAVRRRILGLLPVAWTGPAAYACIGAAVHHYLPSVFWWYIFLAPLPLTIILCRSIQPSWPLRVVTIGDLVNWVIQERRRQS